MDEGDEPWIVEFWNIGFLLRFSVVFDDAGDFPFNILECVERNVGDIMFNTILL